MATHKITRARSMTEHQEQYLGVPPYVVTGKCSKCGARVSVTTYGVRSELAEVTLRCEECKK